MNLNQHIDVRFLFTGYPVIVAADIVVVAVIIIANVTVAAAVTS